MAILLWALAAAMVVIGLVGIVMPALPGHVLILGGLVLASWADDFRHVGVWTLVVIGVLAAASYAIDFVAAAVSTRRLGASRRAVAGAALGTLAGFFFGIIGLIVGPFAGAVIGELTAHRELGRAGRAGIAAWLGFLVGTVVKVGLAFAMVGIFLTAWFVS